MLMYSEAQMITRINQLARKLREKNYFFRRLFDVWMDYLWVDKTIILRFDLDAIDFSRKFEKSISIGI